MKGVHPHGQFCLSVSVFIHISLCHAVLHSLCVCSGLCGFVQSLSHPMWLVELGQPQVKTRTCSLPRGRPVSAGQGVLWTQGQGCFYVMAPGCWGASVTQGHLADMISCSEVVSCGQLRLGQSAQRPRPPWLSCLFPLVLPGREWGQGCNVIIPHLHVCILGLWQLLLSPL